MECILVIDDDPILRTSLRLTFEKAGYRVWEAGDGHAALHIIAAQPFDLVLCDLCLPGPGGLEIICHLHNHHPDVMIMAISASGAEESFDPLAVAVRFGAAVSLRKPFDDQAALAAARDLLAGREAE